MTHKELEKIISDWSQTGLTENFKEKGNISMCLNAQMKFNETKQDGDFTRWSLPLVVRVFSESKAFKNNLFINYFEAKRPEYMFLTAKASNEDVESMEGGDTLTKEAKFISKIAEEIRQEIDEAFKHSRGTEITFHGFGRMIDGTVFMAYN